MLASPSHPKTLVRNTLRLSLLALAVLVAGATARLASPGLAAAGSGPVAAYAFDAGSGSTVADATGNGNIGTIANATWASGKYGGALSFNGVNSMVTIPGSASLSPTQAVTIEAWVQPTTIASWRAVAVKEQTSTALSYGLYSSSKAGGPVALAYTSGEMQATGPAVLAVGAWSHIAAVYSGSLLSIYVNGTLRSQSAVSGPMAESTRALRLGGNSIWSEWFSGAIDELRVYDRALAAGEIQSDMATPITAVDTTAPTTPGGLTVSSNSQSSVTVSWAAASDNVGVTGYGVYRNGSLQGSTAGTSFTFGGLTCGTSYTFGVDAVDAAGNRSAATSVAGSTTACADTTAPSAPGSLATPTRTQTSVTLSWAAASDNVGVTGYGVYRNGALQGSTASTGYTLSGLTCGTTYTFAVDAVDGAGNRSAAASVAGSTAACPDTAAPSVPGSFVASAVTQTSLTLSWAAASDNVGVTGYGAYRTGALQGSTTSTSYTFSGLACGTSYTFGVDAVDGAGNRSAVGSFTGSTSACVSDTSAPSVPSNERFTGTTQSSISLAWDASSDNVAVTGYRAYLNGVSVGTTTSTSYTFGGLACATSYTVSIAAFDAAGNASNPAYAAGTTTTGACTDTQAPTTPAGLAAVASSQTSISLSWSASSDNVAVTSYGAYRGGSLQATPTTTGYTYTGLSCGTSYSLGVDAVDAAGNHSATASLTAATTACAADTTAPSTPTGLAGSAATQTALTLSWSAATDNVAVIGYGVYRNGSLIASTASTSYSYTGLSCGTSYTLAVDAFDAAGNRSASASISASTAACGSSASANLWMSTTAGGSCTRSATAVAFNQATSCGSGQAAFSACQPGDLIGVQAGSYGSQTITGTKASPGCVIDMSASGSAATFSSFSPVSSSASANWLELRNGSIPGGYAWNQTSPEQAPTHLTLRNIDTTSNSLMKGGSDIAIIGGSVHNWDAGNHAAAFWFETNLTSETMPNITVQGVTFHDLTNSVAGNHLEIIRIDTGTSNVLIDGNRFYNNRESTSTIFITNVNSDPGDPHDITIQNNFFGSAPNAYYHIATQTPVVQTCLNIAILYNSFAGSPTTMSGCTTKTNTRIVGNVGPRGSGCESGVTYAYNVWQYSSVSKCGTTDTIVVGSSGTSLLGLTNPSLGDMHLLAGSPAIGAGDPSSYPPLDYDGQARSGTPDAGADKR